MSKFNETPRSGTQKNTVDENPPHKPELPREVLENGLTREYLNAHNNELKVTIKPNAGPYDHVAVKFGTAPKTFTLHAKLSSSSIDTVVIFTTYNIKEVIGNGTHSMSYVLYKLADDSSSPESHTQEVTVDVI
ncbi:hypothetical protein [Pseudomonas brassicacearum]|nr:hypothetical protein [Pseudomonas brassicacearum]